MSLEEIKPPNVSLALETNFLFSGMLSLKSTHFVQEQEQLCFSYNKRTNLYIVSELPNWPGNPRSTFVIENFLFGAVKSTSKAMKRNFICNGYKIAFNGAGLWSFSNDFALYVIVFGVENSSWRHSENSKSRINIRSRKSW